MKNAMLALMLCFGVTACFQDQPAPTDDPPATAGEDTAGQSQADLQVTGHELDPRPTPNASCFIGAQPCIDGGVHTCHFSCCDNPNIEAGAVRSACGNCIGHANDFCQTLGHGGTFTAWWTP
jgi:hypothetical protein